MVNGSLKSALIIAVDSSSNDDSLNSSIQRAIDASSTHAINSADSIYLSIRNLDNLNFNPELLSLISAVIGGILVILGQIIVEYCKRKNVKKIKLINTLGVVITDRGNLKNYFRELSMLKTHAAYWEYFSQIATDLNEKEIRYRNHLERQSEIRNVEREIGNATARFLAHVARFEKFFGNNILNENDRKNIDAIDFRKANKYSTNQSYQDVRTKQVEQDEKELKKEYYSNLEIFDNIISKLEGKIK